MSAGADLRAQIAAETDRLGRSAPRVMALRLRLADGLLVVGSEDEAFATFDAMLADCEADLGPRHETTLVVANNRAMRLAERGRPEGLEVLDALASTAAREWGAIDPRTILIRSNLAAATGMAGRFHDAIAQIEALLELGDALDERAVETLETNLSSWRERAKEP